MSAVESYGWGRRLVMEPGRRVMLVPSRWNRWTTYLLCAAIIAGGTVGLVHHPSWMRGLRYVVGVVFWLWLARLDRDGCGVDGEGVHRNLHRRVLPWHRISDIPAPGRFDNELAVVRDDGKRLHIGLPTEVHPQVLQVWRTCTGSTEPPSSRAARPADPHEGTAQS